LPEFYGIIENGLMKFTVFGMIDQAPKRRLTMQGSDALFFLPNTCYSLLTWIQCWD